MNNVKIDVKIESKKELNNIVPNDIANIIISYIFYREIKRILKQKFNRYKTTHNSLTNENKLDLELELDSEVLRGKNLRLCMVDDKLYKVTINDIHHMYDSKI